MLHPHVPDDVKHFTKHLFATFLGLLMALGLESWREHSVEKRMAREHLEQVEAELARNRKELDERLAEIASERDTLQDYVQRFSEAIRERQNGRRVQLPQRPKLQTPDLSFYGSAWETAKSTGAIRHMEPARLQRISTVYTDMQRVQTVLDQMVLMPAFQDARLFGRRNFETLNPTELDRLAYSLQFVALRQEETFRIGTSIAKELKEAQQP